MPVRWMHVHCSCGLNEYVKMLVPPASMELESMVIKANDHTITLYFLDTERKFEISSMRRGEWVKHKRWICLQISPIISQDT